MKKIISLLLGIALLGTLTVPAYAKDDKMEKALASVKSKIDIPEVMTEFSGNSDTYNGKSAYGFEWHDDNYDNSIQVTCDEQGRISSYWHWDNNKHGSGRLNKYTKDDAKAFAESFLKKAMPEAFMQDDTLVLDEDNIYTSIYDGVNYDFTFKREKAGIPVNNENVSINVCSDNNGMIVENMYTYSYNYDAQFEILSEPIADANSKYMEAFPIKLYYARDYSDYDYTNNAMQDEKTKLVYQIKNYGGGYISAKDGTVREEYYPEDDRYYGNASKEAALMEDEAYSSASGGFTDAEIEELNNVAGLISQQEAERELKKITELKITNDMKVDRCSYIHTDDKYILSIHFTNEDRYLFARLNAKTGEILSISNGGFDYDYDYELTEADKQKSAEIATDFLKKASKYSDKFESTEDIYGHGNIATVPFERLANGIPYDSNYASVSYDVKNKVVTNFYITYTEPEFEDPSSVMDADEVYKNFLAKYPLKLVYVRTGESYELCYTISNPYVDILAKTGEVDIEEREEYTDYPDIAGHWCQDAVKRLAEVGIRFEGSEFKPEAPVTKGELLKFLDKGINDGGYYYDYKEVLNEMKRRGIVEPTCENPDETAVREDAFVYMARLAGFEEIAKLSDIFKVTYADGDQITDGKIGYAAILSGLKVISGSGGYVRPQDTLTRAEAATMLYNYMIR